MGFRKRFWFIYDHLEEIILVIMFAALVAITFLQVFMRFVVNHSLPWPEEAGKYLFVWVSWLGVSIGAKHREHIKIEIFQKKLPHKAANILNIVNDLIMIVICGVVCYYGVKLVDMLLTTHIQNTVLHMNQAVGTSAVPVGCALMIMRCIQSICLSVSKLKNGLPPEGADQPEAWELAELEAAADADRSEKPEDAAEAESDPEKGGDA